jgi:hypothetical protein
MKVDPWEIRCVECGDIQARTGWEDHGARADRESGPICCACAGCEICTAEEQER